MPVPDKLRVAIVPYLNMLPLVHGLSELRLPGERYSELEVTAPTPSRMFAQMEAGELDLGMMPAGGLVRRPGWRVVGGSMIGSSGPVLSVLAISKDPPERWTLLHPDSHSRTSNALVQILLNNRFGVRPRLGYPIPPEAEWSPPDDPDPGEAFLLIGTRALRWRELWRAEGGASLDLGGLWTEWTGLPFIYAVWTAREGVELGGWMEAFEKLKAKNLTRLEAIISHWPGLAFERLTPGEAKDYLTKNIIFDLNDRALEGLSRYYAEGRALGLFPNNWELIRD